MDIATTDIDGLLIVTPTRFGDDRGWFAESWNPRKLPAPLADIAFVQDNQSRSHAKFTVRGLHFQAPPRAQDKLVQCLHGAILDVAVDIRRGSPTYGRHVAIELSAENGRQLFVPKGFLHGFMTLTEDTLVGYKVSDFYDAELDASVHFASRSLGIDWPAGVGDATVSAKDSQGADFSEFNSPFTIVGE